MCTIGRGRGMYSSGRGMAMYNSSRGRAMYSSSRGRVIYSGTSSRVEMRVRAGDWNSFRVGDAVSAKVGIGVVTVNADCSQDPDSCQYHAKV